MNAVKPLTLGVNKYATYGLASNIWNSFDNEERELFIKLFERQIVRRQRLLEQLPLDCRSTVSEYYSEIAANIIADVISQTTLTLG